MVRGRVERKREREREGGGGGGGGVTINLICHNTFVSFISL